MAPNQPAPSARQQVLAAPLPADSSLPKLPESYAQWTENQRKSVPRQIAGRCGLLWSMMNSGGKVALLAAKQGPGRQEMLTQIRGMLDHAAKLGEPLSMPKRLTQ